MKLNSKAGKTFNDISCAVVFCFHSSIEWHLERVWMNTMYVRACLQQIFCSTKLFSHSHFTFLCVHLTQIAKLHIFFINSSFSCSIDLEIVGQSVYIYIIRILFQRKIQLNFHSLEHTSQADKDEIWRASSYWKSVARNEHRFDCDTF